MNAVWDSAPLSLQKSSDSSTQGSTTEFSSVMETSEANPSATFSPNSGTSFSMKATEKRHQFDPILPFLGPVLFFRWSHGPAFLNPTFSQLNSAVLDAILKVNTLKQGDTVVFQAINRLPLDIAIRQEGEKWMITLYSKGPLKQTLQLHSEKLKRHLQQQLNASVDIAIQDLDQVKDLLPTHD